MFCEAYTESVDRCFRIVGDELQRNVFSMDGNVIPPEDRPRSAAASGGNSSSYPYTSYPYTRTPPLASLLPQIKAISINLLQPAAGQSQVSIGDLSPGEFSSPSSGSSIASIVVSQNIREISSGPALDSFCVSILETTESTPSAFKSMP